MPRPRMAETPAGTVVGGALGAAVGGPAGLLLGALLGSAFNAGGPLPLRDAIAQALQERNLALVVFRRDSLYRATVVFQAPDGGNWRRIGRIEPRPGASPADIDDALYDRVLESVDEWRAHAGW